MTRHLDSLLSFHDRLSFPIGINVFFVCIQFQEILKPNYNSVDLTEVELVDNANIDEPRGNDTQLLAVRKNKTKKEFPHTKSRKSYDISLNFYKKKIKIDEM